MTIKIRKRNYAAGILPWCPYVGGFWRNLMTGMTCVCMWGYRIDINRGAAL